MQEVGGKIKVKIKKEEYKNKNIEGGGGIKEKIKEEEE